MEQAVLQQIIDKTPGFIDEFEDILDRLNQIQLQPSDQRAIREPLNSTYNLQSCLQATDKEKSNIFLICRIKPITENYQLISQYLIVTDKEHAILNITRNSSCFMPDYVISGGGILEFNQRATLTRNYLVYDAWKSLFKIHISWNQVLLGCFCCNSIRSSTSRMEVKNLDGSETGSLIYNNADTSVCIHFIPSLNRKAKYMLIAATLIPLSKHYKLL